MSRRILKICIDKFKSLPRDENGAAMMITLAVVLFLYLLCSSSYAIGMTINEKIQLQNAADAAAYSAAVVEADGLSRIATINRAMSWTYIQTVKRRMDYIVFEWLNLTLMRFQEDENMCRAFNDNNYFDLSYQGKYLYLPMRCGEHESGRRGNGTWWCGWDAADGVSDSNALIKLGHLTKDEAKDSNKNDFQYGKMITKAALREILKNYQQFRENLREMMDVEEKLLESLNGLIKINIAKLSNNMHEAAVAALQWNLPRENDTDNEYFYRISVPMCVDPYLEFEEGDKTYMFDGIFSAYKNTEEDELEFLAASLQNYSSTPTTATEKYIETIWDRGFQYKDIFGDGIDQWFIRGKADTFKKDEVYFKADLDDYAMQGFQRGYKSANRGETLLGTSQLRGNHVAYGSFVGALANIIKAVIENWPKESTVPVIACPVIATNFFSSASVFLRGATSDIIPSALNSKNIFVGQCQSPSAMDNYGLVAEYHWASMRWWCAYRWRRVYKIYVPRGKVHYKADSITSCSCHGNGGTGSYSRKDFKQCYVGKYMMNDIGDHGSANKFPGYLTMGYSRIYGDDIAIFAPQYYITPKIEPVKLNKNFFKSRISIAVGKKQKNPFYWFFSTDHNVSTMAPENSIFAIFNPAFGNSRPMQLATSSATAAFRSRRSAGNGHYETAYDQLTSFEYDGNFYEEPTIQLRHGAQVGETDRNAFQQLRVGCAHVDVGNEIARRLKHAWNLCETDWQAVFVPHRYANNNYQAYCSDGNGNFVPYDSYSAVTQNRELYYLPYAAVYTDFIKDLGTPETVNNKYFVPLYGDSSQNASMSVAHPPINKEMRFYTQRQLFERIQKFKLQ